MLNQWTDAMDEADDNEIVVYKGRTMTRKRMDALLIEESRRERDERMFPYKRVLRERLERIRGDIVTMRTVGKTDRLSQTSHLRRLTLTSRAVYGDTTIDTRESPTYLFVLVGGRYHSIFERRFFASIKADYNGKSWHTVTGIHWNTTSGSLNVQLSGFLNFWFYIPKSNYKYTSAEDNRDLFRRGLQVLLVYDPNKKNQMGYKIVKYLPEATRLNVSKDPYPPWADPSAGSYIWRGLRWKEPVEEDVPE